MRFSIAVEIDAPPSAVWAVMSDVERWHEWTASIRSITLLDGAPMRVGSKVRIHQPKFPPAEWTVSAMDPGTGFTWVSRAPGILVTGRHGVEPAAGGSRATLSIEYEGLFGPLFGRMTRAINKRYLGFEAAGLKHRSEEGAS